MPPNLIAAFTSTLEDSIESELLLHVVDASDPWISEKIKIVDDTLAYIGAKQKKIYVFNKIDLLGSEKIAELRASFEEYRPVFVSTYKQE